MSDDRHPRWGAASDLSRVLPEGVVVPSGPVPATDPGTTDVERVPGAAVVSPPAPRPRPTSGLHLSPTGRVLVGVALVAALGFMVWNAWLNVSG